ncbi:hypothetical protein HK098_007552 [Nowakowskiella sp. JEL0407]|nr:hypothetical protein HK098_007552 [Nowakowskiella sp. JEL0407]
MSEVYSALELDSGDDSHEINLSFHTMSPSISAKAPASPSTHRLKNSLKNISLKPSNISPPLWEEFMDFYQNFPSLMTRYQLVDKIGEGTFSTVYKAVDLLHSQFDNTNWCTACQRINEKEINNETMYKERRHTAIVAIKRIYATSSPQRIAAEIEYLALLGGIENISPIITAQRHEDQVVLVLPYFSHEDFKDYYLTMTLDDIRKYMRGLFRALAHMHSFNILHRDIKPSNFLFDTNKKTGILVDFGLAERRMISNDSRNENGNVGGGHSLGKYKVPTKLRPGFLKNDPRPSIRASRAGTRGFRPPEVLMKISNQTIAIDVWAAGVILLSLFSGRFPFFNSRTDAEAFIELAIIFGRDKMKKLCNKYGREFTTTIPSIQPKTPSLASFCDKSYPERSFTVPSDGWDFLDRVLCLDPEFRITAREALDHPFLKIDEDVEMEVFNT